MVHEETQHRPHDGYGRLPSCGDELAKKSMRNDVAVYDALRFDPDAGENVWTGRMGTRAAIVRDGLTFDPVSLSYCPHEWLDEQGYVDLELARKYPHHLGF